MLASIRITPNNGRLLTRGKAEGSDHQTAYVKIRIYNFRGFVLASTVTSRF
jgi:hypothetical protein